MRRRWRDICSLKQRDFALWAVLAIFATRPLLTYAGQAGFGPVPVLVGTVSTQQVATEVEVVGSVEPRLATTLSAEIAGFTQHFDPREGDFVQQGKTVVAQLKATELTLAVNEAEAELAKARADLTRLKRGLRPEEVDEKRAEVAEKKAWVEKYAKDVERTQSLLTRDMVTHAALVARRGTGLSAGGDRRRRGRGPAPDGQGTTAARRRPEDRHSRSGVGVHHGPLC
jgi:multidrug efflux pump subunit AcrA (membrane-fusion protein)